MKAKVEFLSNTVTQSINRFLPQYQCSSFEINTIVQTLNGNVKSDYIVVLLDINYFASDGFLNDESFDKLVSLISLLKIFRKNNSAKVILSNISGIFLDINSSINTQQHQKILDLNLEIEKVNNIEDMTVLNIYQLVNYYGFKNFFNIKNGFMFQAPWTKVALTSISNAITEKIDLFNNVRKKVLILDADNTLWGGVVGEDGVDNITVDQNYPGIVYRFFQNQLKHLKDSGILLTMVSKNNFIDVLEVFKKKNMPLTWDDFVIKKINWNPKSQNIKEILSELNIGFESALFLDDSDFELSEVSSILEIDCIKVSTNNLVENLAIFEDLMSIKTLNISNEDRCKSEQYLTHKKRRKKQDEYTSIDGYLSSIEMKITMSLNNTNQIKRIAQLVNKTNQFNSTTKRYSETEILKIMKSCKVFSFSLIDKFGDLGLISVVIVEGVNIKSFLMSCRALGRGVEKKIMYLIASRYSVPLTADYIKTSKNHQVESFYEKISVKRKTVGTNLITYFFPITIDNINHITEER
jgi:FkbH-like protein